MNGPWRWDWVTPASCCQMNSINSLTAGRRYGSFSVQFSCPRVKRTDGAYQPISTMAYQIRNG